MATRMQQRRGTAAQWTAANPVLAAGEIGFETDTNKFKVGNGSTAWASLTYFVDGSVAFDSAEVTAAIEAAIANVIDLAPETLDTLNELAAAVGDNPNFANNISNDIATINSTIESHSESIANLITDLQSAEWSIGNVNANLGNTIANHESDTTNIHGIANTATLVTTDDSRLSDDRTPVDLSVTTGKIDDEAVTTEKIANAAVSEVKIANSAVTNSKLGADSVDGSKISDDSIASEHIADEVITNAHISNTAAIAQSKIFGLTTDLSNKQDKVADVSNTEIGYLANVTSDIQSQIDAKSPSDSPTFTGTVVLPSNTSIGDVSSTELGYLDGVTSNVQAQLNTKAALAGAAFTGSISTTGDLTVDGNFTVNGSNVLVSATQIQVEDTLLQLGHQNAGNTTDLGVVVGYNDGSAKHSGIVKDVTDGKWKLFKGLTVEPTTTVDFTSATLDTLVLDTLEATSISMGNVSATEIGYLDGVTSAIQTQINSKAPTASPTFTGTVTVSASGVAFTDGTQTKEGVPSRTTILQKTASYTLSDVAERDELIEMNSASGVTITIPADSSVNFPVGTSIDVLQTGAGQVTIAGAGGVTVNGTPGLKLRAQWSSATLFKRAANTWVVMGDLTA